MVNWHVGVDRVGDFDTKLRAKMVLETSGFCARGGPLTVESTVGE